MKLLNIDGKNGPSLKNIFTCDNCKFLGKSAFNINKPYKCYHDDIFLLGKTSYDLMKGDIGENKITPDFCPFLVKQMRNEKLKELKLKLC